MSGRMDNLILWEKGQSGNPNGRPRKFITTLKAQGYKMSEVNDTLLVLISLTAVELKAVYDNPDATVLEKIVAKALNNGYLKGNLDGLETIFSRAFGTPKRSMDLNVQGAVIINEHRQPKNKLEEDVPDQPPKE